jgi:sialic acid synthase SpsE
MVESIRIVEKTLGDKIKKVTKSEKENIKIVRKSIVARKNIIKGDKFSKDNVTTKRPQGGISSLYWKKVIGKIAKKDFKYNEFITLK